jgi:MoaA/NifB/PqqE/SkfB family radical SAM enzyme
MYDSKKILSTEIQVVFNENNKKVFPDNYINNVKYWGNISKEKLHSCLPDGTAKLLTLDLDVGDECSLRCPHCFRRDSRFDKCTNPLTYDEIIKYIKEAKELGLEEIKILGRGEPFQNKDFLRFLREMTKLDIGVSVFTKGFVIGDDNLVKIYNSHYGINTGKELVKE